MSVVDRAHVRLRRQRAPQQDALFTRYRTMTGCPQSSPCPIPNTHTESPGTPPSFPAIRPPIGPAHPHDANTQHMGADRWRMSLFSRNGDFLSHRLNSSLVGFLPGLRSGLFYGGVIPSMGQPDAFTGRPVTP